MAWIAAVVMAVASCGGGSGLDGSDSGEGTTGPSPTAAPATTAAPSTSGPAAGVDRSAELIGRWDIGYYRLPNGSLTNVLGEDAHLTFLADGTLEYGTGCNQGSTTYSTGAGYYVPESALDEVPEGQGITIGPDFTQTEIGCEGFLGQQDTDIPARIGEVTRFGFDGDEMFLADEFLLIEAIRAD